MPEDNGVVEREVSDLCDQVKRHSGRSVSIDDVAAVLLTLEKVRPTLARQSSGHEPVSPTGYEFCGKCGALLPEEAHLECRQSSGLRIEDALPVVLEDPEGIYSSGVGEEEIREVLEPFAAKATLVEQARETWKPSLGPLGGAYTVSVRLSHCRRARALLERLTPKT
jgi:hypothetical protein